MSKQYKVDMNIDVSALHPNGGILMKQVDKEVDPRGFKEQTGVEVFDMICAIGIQNSNPKCSYDQMKGIRKVLKLVHDSVGVGSFVANKTDIDVLINAIKQNPQWPNNNDVEVVLDGVLDKLKNAEICE